MVFGAATESVGVPGGAPGPTCPPAERVAGTCLGLAALGVGRGVPGREAPGGESFQTGWGFQPWESRPYPGAWSTVGTVGGHTGWGAPGLPQRAPRTPLLFLLPAGPRPKDDVTSAAGPRGLAWAPPPQSCQPPHPRVTPGSLSGRAPSPGQPHVVSLSPRPPRWAGAAWPGAAPSHPLEFGVVCEETGQAGGQTLRVRVAPPPGSRSGEAEAGAQDAGVPRDAASPPCPGHSGGAVCSVSTLPAGGVLRLGAISAGGDLRRWLQAPGFDGRFAPQHRPAWPSAAPQRHRAAPHTLLPPSPPQR